jgi:hypothetical protein
MHKRARTREYTHTHTHTHTRTHAHSHTAHTHTHTHTHTPPSGTCRHLERCSTQHPRSTTLVSSLVATSVLALRVRPSFLFFAKTCAPPRRFSSLPLPSKTRTQAQPQSAVAVAAVQAVQALVAHDKAVASQLLVRRVACSFFGCRKSRHSKLVRKQQSRMNKQTNNTSKQTRY